MLPFEIRCIYTRPSLCAGPAPLNDEHWFPRGLGKFKGYEELKAKLCEDCNNRFGTELEDVFLHCGPEALFREIFGNELGRPAHKKHNIFARGAKGHSPILVKGLDPDSGRTILWEVGKNSESKPARQILIADQEGGVDWVRLGALGTPFSDLKLLLRTKQAAGFRPERIYGDSSEDLQQISQLCADVFGDKQVQFVSGEAGIVVSASSVFSLSQPYLRAIAKIGLHSFLHFFPNFSGFEPEFDAVKKFIYHGTKDAQPFA